MAKEISQHVPDSNHFRIELYRESKNYKVPGRPIKGKNIRDSFAEHAAILKEQLVDALNSQSNQSKELRIPINGLNPGNVVEVTTMPPEEDSQTRSTRLPEKLNFPKKDIVVLKSYRNDDRSETGLLFVPDKFQNFLMGRIENYGNTVVVDPENDKKPTSVKRFELIEEFRDNYVVSLFSNCLHLPYGSNLWFEIWVRNSENYVDEFVTAARTAELKIHNQRLEFPEITVIYLNSKREKLEFFAQQVQGVISEIRSAESSTNIFLDHVNSSKKQRFLVDDLAKRIRKPKQRKSTICTLDTGISASHELIQPGLKYAGTVNLKWGVDDDVDKGGHGTPVAGLILHGNLAPILNSSENIELTHFVESMKLLPPERFPPTDPKDYGVVTLTAVSLVEINDANILRTYCLPITSTENPPEIPSSWSASIDQIVSGTRLSNPIDSQSPFDTTNRLFLIATGNVNCSEYDESDELPSIEDPSQSWNALTIGGYTNMDDIPAPPPSYQPVVKAKNRSPYSRGSTQLPFDITPIKPEVLFESGNMLVDKSGFYTEHETVSLLAPGSDVKSKPIIPFWATSAAVALAGQFLGQLQASLSTHWPETHRALVIDSATWPEPYQKKIYSSGGWKNTGHMAKKSARQALLREVGYGVPNIDRAILSARNDVSLIAESNIQPYKPAKRGNSGKYNEMHFYKLPWPKEALVKLENEIVTMRVTLSYFIEPNLSGFSTYRPETYRSFGLNFNIKKRSESSSRFRRRVNAEMDKVESKSTKETDNWLLGESARQSGSLHCDLWRGHAIELAEHDEIAVFPVNGWWKSSGNPETISNNARYSLVISISAKGLDVDLYSEVSNLIEQKLNARNLSI